MRTGEYRLRDGRKVRVRSLHLTRTYEGMLSGTRQAAASTIREMLQAQARQIQASPSPFAGDRSWEAAIAELHVDSGAGVATGDWNSRSGHHSHLSICWFSKGIGTTSMPLSPPIWAPSTGTNTRRTMTSQLCELVDIQASTVAVMMSGCPCCVACEELGDRFHLSRNGPVPLGLP